jgi:hypothetical protein
VISSSSTQPSAAINQHCMNKFADQNYMCILNIGSRL